MVVSSLEIPLNLMDFLRFDILSSGKYDDHSPYHHACQFANLSDIRSVTVTSRRDIRLNQVISFGPSGAFNISIIHDVRSYDPEEWLPRQYLDIAALPFVCNLRELRVQRYSRYDFVSAIVWSKLFPQLAALEHLCLEVHDTSKVFGGLLCGECCRNLPTIQIDTCVIRRRPFCSLFEDLPQYLQSRSEEGYTAIRHVEIKLHRKQNWDLSPSGFTDALKLMRKKVGEFVERVHLPGQGSQYGYA